MHNAAFERLSLDWLYVPLPVRPGSVQDAVRGLGALGLRGANVTVPHKQTAMRSADTLSSAAQALGAVNTLVIEYSPHGIRVHGHNTDIDGVLATLRRENIELSRRQRAIVVGAGGAARAIVYALLTESEFEITLLNRTLDRAVGLVTDLSDICTGAARLSAAPLTPESLISATQDAELLINATAVGMWPHADGSIWPEAAAMPTHLTIFDLVYNPLETRLLQQARQSGARAIDGLNMLIMQGARSFELWTGEPAPVDAMRSACAGALERMKGEER